MAECYVGVEVDPKKRVHFSSEGHITIFQSHNVQVVVRNHLRFVTHHIRKSFYFGVIEISLPISFRDVELPTSPLQRTVHEEIQIKEHHRAERHVKYFVVFNDMFELSGSFAT